MLNSTILCSFAVCEIKSRDFLSLMESTQIKRALCEFLSHQKALFYVNFNICLFIPFLYRTYKLSLYRTPLLPLRSGTETQVYDRHPGNAGFQNRMHGVPHSGHRLFREPDHSGNWLYKAGYREDPYTSPSYVRSLDPSLLLQEIKSPDRDLIPSYGHNHPQI